MCFSVLLHSGMSDMLVLHSSLVSRRPSLVVLCRCSEAEIQRASELRISFLLCLECRYLSLRACHRLYLDLPFRTLSASHTAPLSSAMKSSSIDSGGGVRDCCAWGQMCLRRRCRCLTKRKRTRRIFSGNASQGLHSDLY